MKILFIAGRELQYPRNDVLLRALRRIGQVDVVGSEKHSGSLVLHSLVLGLKAIPKLLQKQYDLVFVGFYGHLLMLLAGILARSPVVFDVFVSNYDTLVHDRKRFPENSLPARLAFWLDKSSCGLAAHLLLDTPLHVDHFVETFRIPQNRFSVLPVGCNEDLFTPRLNHPAGRTIVLYYCTYQPLHGVDTVIRAAALLREESLLFKLIGEGQEYARCRQLARDLRVQNVSFSPSIPLANLPQQIAQANICLGGHFGASDKAGRVIPGKLYQILAMQKPLIASDSPANRSLLTHGEDALLCTPGDPESLAQAILDLHRDPSLGESIAQSGRALYMEKCSESVITQLLEDIIQKLRISN